MDIVRYLKVESYAIVLYVPSRLELGIGAVSGLLSHRTEFCLLNHPSGRGDRHQRIIRCFILVSSPNTSFFFRSRPANIYKTDQKPLHRLSSPYPPTIFYLSLTQQSLSDVPIPRRLIRISLHVRPEPKRGRPALFRVPPLVLAPDEELVDARYDG